MADKKITELTDLTNPIDTDLVPLVDITVPETKHISVSNFMAPVYQAISDATATSNAYTDAPLTIKSVLGAPTAYTLDATDDGNVMVNVSGADPTVVIPTNASVPGFVVGSVVEITHMGTGTLTITHAGVTLQGSVTTVEQYGNIGLIKLATNTWLALGGVSSTTSDVTGPASSVDSNITQFDGITGKIIKDGGKSIDTDTTLAADSANRVPTQHAVKTYVDNSDPGLSQLMLPLLQNSMAVTATQTITLNTMRGMRCIVPRSGHLEKIAFYIGSTFTPGNYIISVYDVGQALNGSFTKLYSSASSAPTSGTKWEIDGGISLAVNKGQHLFITLITDNSSLTIGTSTPLIAANAAFAVAGTLSPDGGNESQYLSWFYNVGSFAAPTTILQSAVTTTTFTGVLIGEVTA